MKRKSALATNPAGLRLAVLPGEYGACRLNANARIPRWVHESPFYSVTRTHEELSILCAQSSVPDGVRCERDWRLIQVLGTLDFSLIGVLASLANPLAEAKVGLLTVSTFDTDYLLVRSRRLGEAIEALRAAGHRFEDEGEGEREDRVAVDSGSEPAPKKIESAPEETEPARSAEAEDDEAPAPRKTRRRRSRSRRRRGSAASAPPAAEEAETTAQAAPPAALTDPEKPVRLKPLPESREAADPEEAGEGDAPEIVDSEDRESGGRESESREPAAAALPSSSPAELLAGLPSGERDAFRIDWDDSDNDADNDADTDVSDDEADSDPFLALVSASKARPRRAPVTGPATEEAGEERAQEADARRGQARKPSTESERVEEEPAEENPAAGESRDGKLQGREPRGRESEDREPASRRSVGRTDRDGAAEADDGDNASGMFTGAIPQDPVETTDDTFDSLGLSPAVIRTLDGIGFVHPTPIQAAVLPMALEGTDIVGLAETGSGKTGAFGLPLVERLRDGRGVRGLILCPTREIALQTKAFLDIFGREHDLETAVVIGGVKFMPQINALRRHPDIIVATPGRLADHMRRGNVRLNKLEELVLDEADHRLDLGFLPQIQEILSQVPEKRRTMMFSATMPPPIERLAGRFLKDPYTVDLRPVNRVAAGIKHRLYLVDDGRQRDCLIQLLRQVDDTTLVFARRKLDTEWLARQIQLAKLPAERLHSDRSQAQRVKALRGFREGRTRILVATDVAARGIDVPQLGHVINFGLPETVEDYVHRAGRTARGKAVGIVSSIGTWQNKVMVKDIERVLGHQIERREADGVPAYRELPRRRGRRRRLL